MRTRWLSSLGAAALLVAACTDAPGPPPADPGPPRAVPAPADPAGAPATAPSPVEAPAGIVRLQGCEPRSLLPANATRRCGQQVVAGLFSQLVELDPDDSEPRWGDPDDLGVAADVASIDARRWVVELEEGWRFHDGSPVTAQSFVDAWNFAAYGPNGQAAAFLLEPIVGFDDLHCPEPGCEPTDTTLDGVRAVDETTLEVVLQAPDRHFPRRLAHVAFSPLPPVAIEDPEAFQEAPVGNGPFRMEGAWAHEERIALRAVEDHPAGTSAVAGVDVLLFEDLGQAWLALEEGRLDVATAWPPVRREQATTRFEHVVRGGDDLEALVIPSYRQALADDARLGRALSMAIDRRRLVDRHLGGAARPAQGLMPPVVSDDADRCGATCRFAPQAARDLLAAVGLPPGGIELWYDRAGNQETWVRAVAGQWRRHLQLEPEQVRVRSLSHTSWLAHLQDQRVGGLYPTGWSMDVATPGEYLGELHGPGGLFNFDRYTGEEVAGRLQVAASAGSDAQAMAAYRELEQTVLADMHHIPLWVRTHEVVHTRRVQDVVLDGTGQVRLAELTLAEDAQA